MYNFYLKMPNPEIKHLFTYSRFPEKCDKVLFSLIYLPAGLIFIILRSILVLSLLLLGFILPDKPIYQKILNKIACLSLGVSVNVEHPNEVEKNVKVYVSTSVSVFDHLALYTAVGAVSPGPQMNATLAAALGTHHFGSPSSLTNFKNAISSYINEKRSPVYFTPDGKITNGRAVLKFKTYPFGLTDAVQPVIVQIKRPFLDISVTTMGAGYWADVFFYMFSPITIYNLKFLPVQKRGSLNEEDFAETIRQLVAQKIGAQLVDYTATDLIEWEKRQVAEQQRSLQNFQVPDRILTMQALQVKEVLPHVPFNVIYEDLGRTRSVDTTISNILEGHISFTPEPLPRQPSPTSSHVSRTTPTTPTTPSTSSSACSSPTTSTCSLSSRTDFNTAAATFGRSAQDRTRSFQERKEQLIATARRRYIQKHNLDIPF